MESGLGLSNEIFKLMIESAREGMCFIDPDGKFIYVNHEMAELVGYSSREIRDKLVTDLLTPESAEIFRQKRADRSAGFRERYELTFVHRDGSLITTLTYAAGAFNHNQVFIGSFGIVADITDVKCAEENLRLKETHLSEAQRIAHIGSFEWMPERRQLVGSAEMFQILGRPPSNHGLDLDLILIQIHHEDRVRFKSAFDVAFQKVGLFEERFRYIGVGGGLRYLQVTGKTIEKAGARQSFLGTIQDITEREASRKLIEGQQAQIISTSKMLALGEMAGGLAHEINNPLAVIQTLSSQIQELIDDDPLDKKLLKEMALIVERTTGRIAKIVQGLRYFARNASQDPILSVRVLDLIDDTVNLCSERLKNRGIKLIREPFSETLCFEGRDIEISQVLLNLLNNAYDAIEHLVDKWIKVTVCEQAASIEIRVTDSGPGISPEVREKIFQPFFTSKEIGKGTGLGLSSALGIIEGYRGHLTLDSNDSHTCFVLQLPKKQS
ncbi:MAG: PAS domain S-box protein [Bdellovibrionia bacterium]